MASKTCSDESLIIIAEAVVLKIKEIINLKAETYTSIVAPLTIVLSPPLKELNKLSCSIRRKTYNEQNVFISFLETSNKVKAQSYFHFQ